MGPKTFWPSRGQTLTPSAFPSLSLSLWMVVVGNGLGDIISALF